MPFGALGEDVVRAKRPERLTVVLRRDELQAVLDRPDGTARLVALLLYGAGLRLTEALHLRVKDLDAERGELLVRVGEGAKDRITILPAVECEPLGVHLTRVRHWHARDLARGA